MLAGQCATSPRPILPKQRVTGSSPVSRSKSSPATASPTANASNSRMTNLRHAWTLIRTGIVHSTPLKSANCCLPPSSTSALLTPGVPHARTSPPRPSNQEVVLRLPGREAGRFAPPQVRQDPNQARKGNLLRAVGPDHAASHLLSGGQWRQGKVVTAISVGSLLAI